MKVDIKKRLKEIRQQILVPQPDESISEWAEKNFVLSRESAAEPGKISFDRTPYLREIVDMMGSINTEKVVVMSSSQIGKTTALNVIMSYYVCQDPAPILFVQPSVELAQSFSKERITPLIRDMPLLNSKISNEKMKTKENTIQNKIFPGGTLNFIGANAPSQLASRPIRILLMDEVSRYPAASVGGGGDEGSPLKLAIRRTANFWNRKVLICSTPGTKGLCHVESEYSKTDQRHYHIPCQSCGDMFTPMWAHVKWDSEGEVHNPASGRIECPNCGHHHDDKDRINMVRQGEWIATYPDREAVGYHLNALISPWTKLKEMIAEWLDCQGKPEALRTFINTMLGEVWDSDKYGVKGVDHLDFMSRVEEYTPETLPKGINFICGGVDVQDDRLEVSLIGYGAENEVWLVEHKVFFGIPAVPAVWEEVLDYLKTVFRREDDVPLKVVATCVDTGGHHTQMAYSWCNANSQRRIFAIKGGSSYSMPIFPKKVSKVGVNKQYRLYIIGTDTGKKHIYTLLSTDVPGAGYVHFPDSVDENYFEQLTAEKMKQVFSKGVAHTIFVNPSKKRNEAIDCFVYSLSARYALNPNFKLIEIRNKKLVGMVEEVRAKVNREPKPDISKKKEAAKVNKEQDDPIGQKMLKKHIKRNQKKGSWVNSW